MVTTGTSGRYNNKSEVIDLMDPTKTCQPWVEYPIGVDSAVGVFIQDKVVICGGDSTFTAGNGAVDRCFALGPSEVTEMTMSAASYSSAAGTFDQSFFISGGYDGKQTLDRTEYISASGMRNGPNLPTPLAGHCNVQISPNELLVTGGSPDGNFGIK